MLQYLVQMTSRDGAPCSFSFSREDLHKIRAAPAGRPVELEHYIAYLTGDAQLALSRRPTHEQAVVVAHRDLCRKLTEVEIEVGEQNPCC